MRSRSRSRSTAVLGSSTSPKGDEEVAEGLEFTSAVRRRFRVEAGAGSLRGGGDEEEEGAADTLEDNRALEDEPYPSGFRIFLDQNDDEGMSPKHSQIQS